MKSQLQVFIVLMAYFSDKGVVSDGAKENYFL